MPRKSQDGPVSLRTKPLANGGLSLYLDIYVNNKRSYEFLHLHLVPEHSRADKDRNKNTLSLANAIKARRIIEIQNGEYGFKNKAGDIDLLTYFNNVEASHDLAPNSRIIWKANGKYMKEYGADKIKLSDVNTKWLNGFIDFLRASGMKRNTVFAYYTKLQCALNKAVKEGVISPAAIANTNTVRQYQSQRTYLTLDELRQLAATPCPDNVKNPFLFSCLTGLRHSDVRQLTWANVSINNGTTRITFRQKKTKGQEYLDISPQAVQYMGKPSSPDKYIFHLPNAITSRINWAIKKWAVQAGITKDISFHTARHTFATLMLTLDVDIYTVSKLLGHSNIKTTQIYAKIIDKKKQQAVNLIPSLNPDIDPKENTKE